MHTYIGTLYLALTDLPGKYCDIETRDYQELSVCVSMEIPRNKIGR